MGHALRTKMSALFGNRTLKIADSHQSVGRHDSEFVKLNNKVYHMHMYTYCTSVYAHAHSVYIPGMEIELCRAPIRCYVITAISHYVRHCLQAEWLQDASTKTEEIWMSSHKFSQ